MPTATRSRLVRAGQLSLIALACATAAPSAASAYSPSACAHATTPAVAASRQVLRQAVVCLINVQRTSRGLPALRQSARLNHSAQRWTNKMVRDHEFTHGSNFAGRITATGFSWSIAGENIATGFATPWQVVQGWMASPGHCSNILSPDFLRVGTGVDRHGVPGYGTGATWTQDFALPMGARLPSHNSGPANGCPYNV